MKELVKIVRRMRSALGPLWRNIGPSAIRVILEEELSNSLLKTQW